MILAHDLLIMRGVAATVPALNAPNLNGLRQNAETVLDRLPEAADLLLFHKLTTREAALSPPPLQLLGDIASRVAVKLPFAHELKVLEKTASVLLTLQTPPLTTLYGVAEHVAAKVLAAHDSRILSGLHETMRQHKALEYFHGMARWAGGDLHRWERVRRHCGKDLFLRVIFQQEARSASTAFAELHRQAKTGRDNWRAMLEQCLSNPFLRRELALFIQKQKALRDKEQSADSPSSLLPAQDDAASPQETALPEDSEQNAFVPFDP